MSETQNGPPPPVDSAACYRLWAEMAEMGLRLALSTASEDPAECEAARIRLGRDIALDGKSREEAHWRMLSVMARARERA